MSGDLSPPHTPPPVRGPWERAPLNTHTPLRLKVKVQVAGLRPGARTKNKNCVTSGKRDNRKELVLVRVYSGAAPVNINDLKLAQN